MAPSLRGRLVCFYCGCRSAQTWKTQLRRWQCEKCEAVNHLDEKGEITDPPATEIATNTRYAQSVQRLEPSAFKIPQDTLFCQTCLKNQHVLAESLASYFPLQDTPNYREYEKQYPKFRKDLEQRYPQVCEDCEPRVRERIRATGYAAKTDHLRRLMERTRGGFTFHNRSRWKILLVFFGGTAWALSIASQAAWHCFGLLLAEQDDGELINEDTPESSLYCVYQALRGLRLPSGCQSMANFVARFAILLGIASFWWNPKMRERLTKVGGRMVGQSEYYKLQGILLATRCFAWLYIVDIQSTQSPQTTQATHGGLLFFGALLTVTSFRAIGIDYTPKVTFEDSTELIEHRQPQPKSEGVKPEFSLHESPRLYSTNLRNGYNKQAFSINDFAPQQMQTQPVPYQSPYPPPTPPPDKSDDGAMDWTPSQKINLRPATLPQTSILRTQQQSANPFRGHLPGDVVSMEHRLRNPPNKPTFRKASETQKQNFFRTPNKRAQRDWDNASDTATEYEPSILESETPATIKFADPKLRIPYGQPADTGLERLLAYAFTLDDEPQEVRAIQEAELQATREARTRNKTRPPRWHRLLMLVSLAIPYCFWMGMFSSKLGHPAQWQLLTLFICSIASVRSLILELWTSSNHWSGGDIVVFSAELAASIIFILATRKRPPATPSAIDSRRPLDSMAVTSVVIIIVQELWLLILDLRSAPNSETLSRSSRPDAVLSDEDTPPYAQPMIKEKSQNTKATIASGTQSALPVTHRSTRSQTKENDAVAAGGFGNLSLGGSGGNGQLASRRGNRSGMW